MKNPLINTQDDPIGAKMHANWLRKQETKAKEEDTNDDMSLKSMKKFPNGQRVLGAATDGDDDKLAKPVENTQLTESGFGQVTKSVMRKLQQL